MRSTGQLNIYNNQKAHTKRVVIIAPDFSPSSLPPALRVRFFATHLPSFGWEPIILSVDPQYYQWSIDPENEALVPPDTRVLRTKAFPAKAARRMGVGCIGIRSVWHHWRVLKRLCLREKPDLLFIPVPPFLPMLLGRLAHERFGIPYVIDYIDPWVTDYYQRMPKSQRPTNWFAADWMSRTVEPYALRKVAHLTAVSRGTTDGIIPRYPWLTKDQATEIPYGGEPADFEYLRQHPRCQKFFRKKDGLLHVSYVGRGGADMNLALKGVFSCFRNGLTKSPELFEKVRFHFVGTTYAPDATGQYQVLPLAEQFGLTSYVAEHPGRVPYLEALQILLDSDALLSVGSTSTHYTASKIFPYIMADRPLLAVYHAASSVVNILRENHRGIVVTFSESKPEKQFLEEVTLGLRDLITTTDSFRPSALPEKFSDYTTRAMSARLARVFNGITISRKHNTEYAYVGN